MGEGIRIPAASKVARSTKLSPFLSRMGGAGLRIARGALQTEEQSLTL